MRHCPSSLMASVAHHRLSFLSTSTAAASVSIRFTAAASLARRRRRTRQHAFASPRLSLIRMLQVKALRPNGPSSRFSPVVKHYCSQAAVTATCFCTRRGRETKKCSTSDMVFDVSRGEKKSERADDEKMTSMSYTLRFDTLILGINFVPPSAS